MDLERNDEKKRKKDKTRRKGRLVAESQQRDDMESSETAEEQQEESSVTRESSTGPRAESGRSGAQKRRARGHKKLIGRIVEERLDGDIDVKVSDLKPLFDRNTMSLSPLLCCPFEGSIEGDLLQTRESGIRIRFRSHS